MADKKYDEGELAIELAYDISGGLGRHKKGTVLRKLSSSAFIGLRAGGHKVAHGGDQPEVAIQKAPPAPAGK